MGNFLEIREVFGITDCENIGTWRIIQLCCAGLMLSECKVASIGQKKTCTVFFNSAGLTLFIRYERIPLKLKFMGMFDKGAQQVDRRLHVVFMHRFDH